MPDRIVLNEIKRRICSYAEKAISEASKKHWIKAWETSCEALSLAIEYGLVEHKKDLFRLRGCITRRKLTAKWSS